MTGAVAKSFGLPTHFFHEYVKAGAVLLIVGAALFLVGVVLHRVVARRQVLGDGVHGVIGRFGGGKSYFLAWVAWLCKKTGRAVYANIHIAGCHYFILVDRVVVTDVVELCWCGEEHTFMTIPDGAAVLVDEAHLVFPRGVRDLPLQVMGRLSQLRHHRQLMFWVTQHWTMVHPMLRKVCFRVWLGEAYAGGHRYSEFTGAMFPLDGRIKAGKREKDRMSRMRVRRKKKIMESYDTLEDVVVTSLWLVPVKERRGLPA